MTVESAKCPAKRTGLRSIETWAIVALLVGAGIAMGYPLGQIVVRGEAKDQVDEIRKAYAEAANSKDDLIQQCLAKAGGAADTAKDAADTAKSAAQSAEQAVEASKQ